MPKNNPGWFFGAASVAIAILLVNTHAAPTLCIPRKIMTYVGFCPRIVRAEPIVNNAKT